jgi:hypothetical protein
MNFSTFLAVVAATMLVFVGTTVAIDRFPDGIKEMRLGEAANAPILHCKMEKAGIEEPIFEEPVYETPIETPIFDEPVIESITLSDPTPETTSPMTFEYIKEDIKETIKIRSEIILTKSPKRKICLDCLTASNKPISNDCIIIVKVENNTTTIKSTAILATTPLTG